MSRKAFLMLIAVLLGVVIVCLFPPASGAETNCKTIKCLNGALDAAKAEAATADQKIRDELARQKTEQERLSGEIEKLKAPATPPSPQPGGKGFPNTDDGKPVMQVGLAALDYVGLLEPFIDELRMGGCGWTATGNGKPALNCQALIAVGLIDPVTFDPTGMPQGYGWMSSGLFRFGARYFPEKFAGTWVVEWEGSATAQCGFGHPTARINANRIECAYPASNLDWSRVDFTAIGAGFKNPRVFKKEYEARLKAGEVFTPQFVEHVRPYKIVRTMEPQLTNVTWVRSVSHIAKKTQHGWNQDPRLVGDDGKVIPRSIPRSVPVEALFDLAVASETALWTHLPPYTGAPESFDDAAFLADGEKIRAYVKANAVAILGSPEWRAYAHEIVRSLKASGYPRDRMLYVELANEVWNFAHPFWRATNYFWGLGDGVRPGKGYSFALGYFTAKAHVEIEAELADPKNGVAGQPFTMVLATQMATPSTTGAALEGYKAYFSERNIDPAPYLKRLGVSTASYYHGAFTWGNGVSAGIFPGLGVEAWKAKWRNEIAGDREGLARRVADYVITGKAPGAATNETGTLPFLIQRRNEHQAIAEAAGAFFLGDYEGESHDTGGIMDDPMIAAFAKYLRYGPQGERMTKAWAEAMRAQNAAAVIANFVTVCAVDVSVDWPWCDGFYGEENGRTRALAPLLRQ